MDVLSLDAGLEMPERRMADLGLARRREVPAGDDVFLRMPEIEAPPGFEPLLMREGIAAGDGEEAERQRQWVLDWRVEEERKMQATREGKRLETAGRASAEGGPGAVGEVRAQPQGVPATGIAAPAGRSIEGSLLHGGLSAGDLGLRLLP